MAHAHFVGGKREVKVIFSHLAYQVHNCTVSVLLINFIIIITIDKVAVLVYYGPVVLQMRMGLF